MKATTKTILSRLSSGKMERQEATLALSALICELRGEQHRLLYSGECQRKGQLESILDQLGGALRARRSLIEGGGVFVTTITGARIRALFSMYIPLPIFIKDGMGEVIPVLERSLLEMIEHNVVMEKSTRDPGERQTRMVMHLSGLFGEPHHSIVGSNVLLLTLNEGGFGGMDIEVKKI